MNVRDICNVLGEIAPLSLAAEWDNVGLLVGDGRAAVRKILLCIDLTEKVLAEAVRVRAQMVMAYHPVIFKSVTRVTPEAAPMVFQAARRGIAVYSMHTALDAAEGGTNDVLADVLDLHDRKPLDPARRTDRCKVVVFLPAEDLSSVAGAAFAAGAGVIGEYRGCSFIGHGVGTFYGSEHSNPAVGQAGRHEAAEEVRLEMIAPTGRVEDIRRAVRGVHSYEEPAIDVYPLLDAPAGLGLGRVGRLAKPASLETLIRRVKRALGVSRVLLAGDGKNAKRRIGVAAVAAGSAGSIWKSAAAAGATLYLTGEMRHHDALAAAEAGMSVVCVGHSHSERITLGRLAEALTARRPKLRVALAQSDRDPFEIL
ncbi:MAG: Nif3-like dinuclear metal center hexameric protein [Phycisphaerae bacterium]|nr:Nif3-like dinuclear metal center hexameric protein [Phycisphaerae bacterium]